MSTTTLTGLPNELLLWITRCIPGGIDDRQQTLLNLSRVCRCLRPIATEALFEERPVVNLFAISGLVRILLKYPALGSKLKTLEIRSLVPLEKKAIVDPIILEGVPKQVAEFDPGLIQDCARFIKSANTLHCQPSEDKWLQDLLLNDKTAYLAIALSLLPNLKEFYLAENDIHHLSMFYDVLITPHLGEPVIWNIPNHWGRDYIDEIFGKLAPKLTLLELPVVWWPKPRLPFLWLQQPYHVPSLVSLTNFSSLRHLVLSKLAFRNKDGSFPLLPPNLETLTIVDDSEDTPCTSEDFYNNSVQIRTWSISPSTAVVADYNAKNMWQRAYNMVLERNFGKEKFQGMLRTPMAVCGRGIGNGEYEATRD